MSTELATERIGTVVHMHNGQNATCVAYRSSHDVDVLFEDGTLIEHRDWKNFIRGRCLKPKIPFADRVGYQVVTKNGQTLTCVGYEDCYHVDVQFDDGHVVHGKAWGDFIHGKVGRFSTERPAKAPLKRDKDLCKRADERIGTVSTAKNGQKMTCIAYRLAHDIDVRFEDGTVVKNCKWGKFLKGNVKNPNVPAAFYNKERFSRTASERIGVVKKMSCGKKAECIAYRGSHDVDVKFDDGYIAENVTWTNFEKGNVRHPDYRINFKGSKRIGEQSINQDKLVMTIVEYTGAKNMKVQFDDGTIVGTDYNSFKLGKTINPNNHHRYFPSVKKRIGQTYHCSNGMTCKVVDVAPGNIYRVKFEDGTTVEAVEKQLRTGSVHHQTLKTRGYGHFLKWKTLYAFNTHNTTFYKCFDENGKMTIMSPQMMMQQAEVKPKL